MTAANEPTSLLDAARSARAAGLCVIPAATDGTKKPYPDEGGWKRWQTELPDDATLDRWFAGSRYGGMGLVCGHVSGDLEMLEFEGRAVNEGILDALIDAAQATGLGDVCERIASGYQERTPSGGIHWFFHCREVGKNVKLACRPATADELADNPHDRIKVLIETRGEGGFCIVAPSNGTTHPTGRPWTLLTGGFGTVTTITGEERTALLTLAETFDRMPEPTGSTGVEPAQAGSGSPAVDRLSQGFGSTGVEDRPGDLYNAQTTWPEILEPEGWVRVYDRENIVYWRRPGARTLGHDATTNSLGTDRLKAHSTSTTFDSTTTFDRFGAYAALHHGGDIRAAAVTLAEKGYKAPEVRPEDLVAADTPVVALQTTVEPVPTRSHLRGGATFVLDDPADLNPIWGTGDEVLWASGEELLLAGPTGTGKTTLSIQILAGLLGITDNVLGLPVTPADKPVLYFAMDRPRQIRRAMRRIFGEQHRAILDERLIVWEGPLPLDLGHVPDTLLETVREAGAGTVILDSLKDAAVKLSDDEVGGNLNRAIQLCLREGIEVAALHHQRKGQSGSKPNTLEDVYGSTWITAGAGSIVLLWGVAGDPIVELRHLKQPASEIGPLRIEHDHLAGTTTVFRAFDALRYLLLQPRGCTVMDAARAQFEKTSPTDNEQRKTRRAFDSLVTKGLAWRDEPIRGGTHDGVAGATAARYFATKTDPEGLL